MRYVIIRAQPHIDRWKDRKYLVLTLPPARHGSIFSLRPRLELYNIGPAVLI